jgi:PAS domain S-box-containing protein
MRFLLNTLLARLLVGSAVPLVLFTAVGLVAAIVIDRLLDALKWERHTHQVLIEALHQRQRVEAMNDAISTLPPDRVAGSSAYKDARVAFLEHHRRLLELVEDNPKQYQAARQIGRLADQFDLMVRFDQHELSGRGGQLLRDLGRAIRTFIAAEEAVLRQRREVADRQAQRSTWIISVAAGLALVVAVAVSLQIARSVTGPVDRLSEAAGELMTGHSRTLTPEGPEELARLMVRFNHMALTLSQRTGLLQQEGERYRTYLGAVSHILWTTDDAGLVVGDLPTWRTFTGQSEAEIQGQGWLDALHPEDRPRVEQAWKDAVEQCTPYAVECRLRSAKGEYRCFSCRGVPVTAQDGKVREWIGTCTDITESKEQESLRRAKEAAEAASQTKSEFLARMSHELRTPLNVILGMSKMLTTQRFGPLNAKQSDYLADILRCGEHLLALINDVLDLAKVEAGKMDLHSDRFALAEMMAALASTLRPLAQSKALALNLRPPAEDGVVESDPARFRQVLYNLLSNAIKFTPQGQVTVAWEWVRSPELGAEVVPPGQARAMRVAVTDTGIGIAPEDQAAVWDEFRQVKPQPDGPPGTGLGLALTRRLVGLLGGRIALRSEVGVGSTFTFVLPRTLPAREQAEAPPRGGGPLALVVEDHQPTARLVADWLASAGLATATARDGEEGLDLARQLQPRLVVLDLHLPRLDGWQVLTELKGDPATARIPVVVVSVSSPREAIQKELSSPLSWAREFFVKPVEREAFLGRLRELVPDLFQPGQGARVLVVDDDPAARKLLGELLRGEGAEVVEAGDGAQALEALHGARPDLLLVDLLMPGTDGFAVVDEVRARPDLDDLPILVVTAKDLTESDRQRLTGRIQALLSKDRLSPERLREYLAALGLAVSS